MSPSLLRFCDVFDRKTCTKYETERETKRSKSFISNILISDKLFYPSHFPRHFQSVPSWDFPQFFHADLGGVHVPATSSCCSCETAVCEGKKGVTDQRQWLLEGQRPFLDSTDPFPVSSRDSRGVFWPRLLQEGQDNCTATWNSAYEPLNKVFILS